MKQRKRRFETLVFYNHTGIERHLEKMEKQGWLIEKISNEFWTYRRIEPADLTFTVTYYPLASEFDPEYSEPQKRLHDFCADTGRKLACTWFQMQVFYNEEKDPNPWNAEHAYRLILDDGTETNRYLVCYKDLFADLQFSWEPTAEQKNTVSQKLDMTTW